METDEIDDPLLRPRLIVELSPYGPLDSGKAIGDVELGEIDRGELCPEDVTDWRREGIGIGNDDDEPVKFLPGLVTA